MRRVAVRVTADAARRVRGGHPWVFDASITHAPADAAPGDLAVVFDPDRRFAGIGLYDPASPIRVKLLAAREQVPIDAAFLDGRIGAAIDRRAPLAADRSTTGYRLVHGENDGLPGLVVDRYGASAVVKLYTAAWYPHLDAVLASLRGRMAPERVVLRLGRSVRPPQGAPGDGTALAGRLPDGPITFHEHGLVFGADVVHGQKTGWFLDQRDNRQRVRSMAAGRRVLDVFCAGGGFTVHAMAGGAAAVISVDAAAPAVAATERHVAANRKLPRARRCHHHGVVGDAFAVMTELVARRERFDLVVVDPPSFTRSAADVDRALAAYGRLTELAVTLCDRGAVLVQSSCSSRVSATRFDAAVDAGARRAGRPIEVFERTDHPLDHPIGFPEGAYLKTVFARVP